MNDLNENQPNPHEPVAFCQNCGKPLSSETVRRVGTAVFCEPCLAARISAAPPTPGYQPVNPGFPPYSGAPPYGAPWNTEVPLSAAPPAGPNPGLAALLGFIPGVGAMYNEQYAKGVAHLLIFAVLVMFSHISGIFVLFVFGWEFYMAIEAHHTAKARRDGTPLPNPFGLNDIGERMGFGRAAWPAGTDVAGAARDAAEAAAAGIGSATAGFSRTPAGTVPPAAQPYGQAYAPPFTPPYVPPAAPPPADPAQPPYGQPCNAPFTPPYTPAPSYTETFSAPAAVSPPIPPPSRFPAGAIWLIALGLFFLLTTLGIFNAVPGSALVGIVLLALGVWTFLRRMTDSGQPLASDGSPAYRLRVLRALRGAIWLIAIGLLFLLDSFRLIRWDSSWPFLIILAGLMMLIERAAYNSAASAAAYAAHIQPVPVAGSNPTSIISTDTTPSNEGGR